MPKEAFQKIEEYVSGNKKVKKALQTFEKAQKNYESATFAMNFKKRKSNGSNAVSDKGSYNVHVSGTSRKY